MSEVKTTLKVWLHPAYVATLILLAVINLVLVVAAVSGKPLWRMLTMHMSLMLAFTILSFLMSRYAATAWVFHIRALAIVGIMIYLYNSLGQIAFLAWNGTADAALAQLDRRIFFGHSPSIWLNMRLRPWHIEFLSIIYIVFIPYLYVSILLGCIGRPAAEVREFITAYALTYSISFLGYLFVPSRGPVVELASQFPVTLDGGILHGIVLQGIQAAGGPHGAFPSLHIGASSMVCLFDLRYNHVRGLTYIPLVVLIAVSTIALQYHYFIDLVAGFAIAVFSLWLARKFRMVHCPITMAARQNWQRNREDVVPAA